MPSDFDAYLESKKMDATAFKKAEENLYVRWEAEFAEMHPESFTAQKLYLINPLRRKYPLKNVEKAASKPASAPRPKIMMKPKNTES